VGCSNDDTAARWQGPCHAWRRLFSLNDYPQADSKQHAAVDCEVTVCSVVVIGTITMNNANAMIGQC